MPIRIEPGPPRTTSDVLFARLFPLPQHIARRTSQTNSKKKTQTNRFIAKNYSQTNRLCRRDRLISAKERNLQQKPIDSRNKIPKTLPTRIERAPSHTEPTVLTARSLPLLPRIERKTTQENSKKKTNQQTNRFCCRNRLICANKMSKTFTDEDRTRTFAHRVRRLNHFAIAASAQRDTKIRSRCFENDPTNQSFLLQKTIEFYNRTQVAAETDRFAQQNAKDSALEDRTRSVTHKTQPLDHLLLVALSNITRNTAQEISNKSPKKQSFVLPQKPIDF